MWDDNEYDDYQGDESDLRNYCAVCGHDYVNADKPHNTRACEESQS